jgi:multiple antibiotic resistance protein
MDFLIALISIVNPIAIVPVWLSMTDGMDKVERIELMKRVAVNSFLLLTFIIFFGGYFFSFFGISLVALRMAGALVIISIAYNMLLNGGKKVSKKVIRKDMERNDISFSPLTLPLTIGPGTIAVVVANTNGFSYIIDYLTYLHFWASSLFVCGIVYLALRFSESIFKIVGHGGVNGISKFMAFVTMCVGCQMLVTSIYELVKI